MRHTLHFLRTRLLSLAAVTLLAGCAGELELEEDSASTAEAGSGLVTQGSILFVGNSFTHGNEEPVYSYNKAAITDANGSAMGGVPGIFKQLTVQAGFTFNVTIEAVSSETLSGHYSTKASIIGRVWDNVVLQEQSTRPLPTGHGGDPAAFFSGASSLRSLVLASNPAAKVFLYETWASPASVTAQGYSAGTVGLQEMQSDLRNAYFKARYDSSFTNVARVGMGSCARSIRGWRIRIPPMASPREPSTCGAPRTAAMRASTAATYRRR